MNAALLSSKKMDYCTPQGFFDELNREFHFTLDAAATAKSAKCPMYYTPETDGLKSPWNLAGGGYGVLQSSIRARSWQVGSQGLRRSAERNNRRFADSVPVEEVTRESRRVLNQPPVYRHTLERDPAQGTMFEAEQTTAEEEE